MGDKEYLLKLYKIKNKIMGSLLDKEHYHKKMDWEKSRSYAAGAYKAYQNVLEDIENIIKDIENTGNQP